MGSRKNASPKKPSPSTSPTRRVARRRRVATGPHPMTLRQRNLHHQTVAPLSSLSATTNLSPTSPLTPPNEDAAVADASFMSGPLTPEPLTPTPLIDPRSKAIAPIIYQDADVAEASFMFGPLTPEPPTPTPMIDQDQISFFQLGVQNFEARRTPTPMTFQDADQTGAPFMSGALTPEPPVAMADEDGVTAFQLEVERFEARSDAVIAEQERALDSLKDKQAVIQEKYNLQSVQKKLDEDLAAPLDVAILFAYDVSIGIEPNMFKGVRIILKPLRVFSRSGNL
ncbi:hypothetical protein F5878DRAFT_646223 [Lentinula raphanica]|uniref:Uncharacterized protein n=1 Tax=Lentinula raphanica TaxID=153919 RepID=A0AA38U697_9AGAR|nr:hypothetical protein F5878DRAFT_646223 [Lentinula raphanica]